MINTVNMPRAYSEIYAFLNVMGEEYKNKIPEKIYKSIENNRDLNYNPIYEINQTLTKYMISKEALALIAGLNLDYWCEDEEEKARLKQCYKENSMKEQEKYSAEKLFLREPIREKTESQIDTIEKTQMIDVKETNHIFMKLWKKLKNWWYQKSRM